MAASIAQPAAKRTKLSAPYGGLGAVLSGKDEDRIITAATTNGLKSTGRIRADESKAAIMSGTGDDVDMQDVVQISSAEESSEDEDDDMFAEGKNEEERATAASSGVAGEADEPNGDDDVPKTNGKEHDEEEEEEEDGDAGAEEPSFGKLLQANAPEPIDVEASLDDPAARRKLDQSTNTSRTLSAPSATSLGTVLTQGLRTNDKDMLESCFQMNDLESIRSTIERLDSSLVSNLLQRLAERLHKRPGRAGNLMIWVQWAFVSHGGYLAGDADARRQLESLNRVIKERASGLLPLLALKGKLDMLSAQLELRKGMQQPSSIDPEDDEGVIYVEGEDDYGSSEEEDAQLKSIGTAARSSVGDVGGASSVLDQIAGEDEDDDDDMPNVNGINGETDEEDEDDDEEEDGDEDEMLDDEAEETDVDTGEDMSDPEMEDDDLDEGESLDEGVPPQPTKSSKGPRRAAR